MELQHIYSYGISTGIFLSVSLSYFLFALSYFRHNQKTNYHASALFFYGAISVLCFTLFDISTIPYEGLHSPNEMLTIFPSWLIIFGTFIVPFGIFLNFHLFMQSLPIQTIEIYLLWNKYRSAYPLVAVFYLVSFIALLLINEQFQNPQRSMMTLSTSLIVINHIILLPLFLHTLKTIEVSHSYMKELLLLIICFVGLISLLLTGEYDSLPNHGSFLQNTLHILLATVYLIYNFVLACYIIQGSIILEGISGFNTTNLYKDIYTALKNDEFFLEYQPQVNLRTQKLEGMEALIRWQSIKKGLISPIQFIPLAEKTQLIDNICEFVIEQVCQDIKILHQNNIDTCISINFSVNNLHPKMINFLYQRLQYHNLPTSAVLVEITESIFLDLDQKTREALALLHQFGIGISLDDFGAGYSSLRHLSDMGLSEVKIDRSLINKIHEPKQKAIISAILTMCKSLKIAVVAEGVKKDESIDILLDINCDVGQGYDISHPKKLTTIIQWIQSV